MISSVLTLLAVALAYLIGAIPFGFLIARAVAGIDIRTVGSGNIGATNVGRVLGFRFFLGVFLLDLLKGFLPTCLLPLAVLGLAGGVTPETRVLVALGTILGHNFPVYLKFRGGKGVATSLGALLALDAVAGFAAAIGFMIYLLVTRYVSVSSLLGGVTFVAVHFALVEQPWSRGERAMTVLTFALLALLAARHWKNLIRIYAGTEPKVNLRKKKKPPHGRVAWVLLLVVLLASLGVARGLSRLSARKTEVVIGATRLSEVARVGTGHQRADRLVFADGGHLLAVTCPRYDRLVLYRVTDRETLDTVGDIELEGTPVAVRATRDRLFVLERPSGDRRHVEPGWWETFDFEGRPVGSRRRAGMYPDDLALTPDGRYALVLTSGRGEGDPDKPLPALDVYDLAADSTRAVGHLDFDRPGDDPGRLSVSELGKAAAVSLLGPTGTEIAALDLADPTQPRVLGRAPCADDVLPSLSITDGDSIVLPGGRDQDGLRVARHEGPGGWVVCAGDRESGLLLLDASTRRDLGRLPLRSGTLNLGLVRPLGLAFAPERDLLAVASRSGAVHLIALRPVAGSRGSVAISAKIQAKGTVTPILSTRR